MMIVDDFRVGLILFSGIIELSFTDKKLPDFRYVISVQI